MEEKTVLLQNVVLYLDNDFSFPCESFSIEKATASYDIDTIEAPLENGVSSLDNMVVKPQIIRISGVFDIYKHFDKDLVKRELEIIDRKIERRDIKDSSITGLFFSVATRDSMYQNLMLTRMPDTNTPEKLTLSQVDFEFKECIIVQGQGGKSTSNPEDSNFKRT